MVKNINKVRYSTLFKNLVYKNGYLKTTIKEAVAALYSDLKKLEAVHIKIDHPNPSTWRKKKYWHISKTKIYSRLDEWIFVNLVEQDEYAAYLERYRSAWARGEIEDIDDHVMSAHYRPQAIATLRRKKFFNVTNWTKKRIKLKYRRRYNIYWKNGEEVVFDYRNPVESLFILRNKSEKKVIGIGGCGSSGQREMNTFFTAVFYVLSKKKKIPHYLLKYNGLNEFEYIGRKYKPVLTPGFGSNFALNKSLFNKILDKGFDWK